MYALTTREWMIIPNPLAPPCKYQDAGPGIGNLHYPRPFKGQWRVLNPGRYSQGADTPKIRPANVLARALLGETPAERSATPS